MNLPSLSPSTQVAALCLKRALDAANAALTVQEGLYRAYKAHLCTLDPLDDVPPPLQASVHALVLDLGGAFGFDEATGVKVRESTLGCSQAALLLARLKSIASSAEDLAERSTLAEMH